MGKQQLKLLLIAASALAMLVTSMFVLPWFTADIVSNQIELDLRSASVCTALNECATVSLSRFGGAYATAGTAAFWLGLLVLVLVVIQAASRLVTGAANDRLTRIGYVIACGATLAGFAVSFLFAPELGVKDVGMGMSMAVERTWAPLAFIVGNLLALMTFFQSVTEWGSDDAEYKPIKLDRADKGRLPVTPLSVGRVTPQSTPAQSARAPIGTPPGSAPLGDKRTRTPSGRIPLPDSLPLEGGRPGDGARPRTPSSQPLGDARARTPSQAPVGERRARTPSGRIPLPDSLPLEGGIEARTPPSDEVRVRIDGASDARSRTPSQAPLGESRRAPTSPGETRRAPTSPGETRRPPSSPGETRNRPPTTPPGMAAIEVDSRQKSPSQPPFVARTPSPSQGVPFGGRTPSPSQGVPFGGRTPSPSQGVPFGGRAPSPSQIVPLDARTTSLVDPVERSRTSSSGPIDIAGRLSATAPNPLGELAGRVGASASPLADLPGRPGALEVSIRPPLPSPEPIPANQIPVDPAAGLTIRKRTPSAAPLPDSAFAPPIAIATPPESGLVIRKKTPTAVQAPAAGPTGAMPAIAADAIPELAELKKELSRPIAIPVVPPELPTPIRGRVKFAVVNVELASTGVRAKREDGTDLIIDWEKIVGVIARRLPPDAPFESATMVDIVSTAGSTLRVLPWTRIVGGLPLSDAPVERARELVNVIAAQALGAKLDPATKLFADGTGQAAQLPTSATLATHDSRLA